MASNWVDTMEFMMSNEPGAATYLQSADLDSLPKSFSFSTYLSPGGLYQVAPFVITHKGNPIDGSLLVCLALSEECRKLSKAVVYHLPARINSTVGHAGDLVFNLKRWSDQEKQDWDNGSFTKRLEMMNVDETCYGKWCHLP